MNNYRSDISQRSEISLDIGAGSVSVYLGTTINKQQIMPQKTNRIRTAFVLFSGHLKQLYGFLVRCPDKQQGQKEKKREASLDLIVHFNKDIQVR